MWEVNRDWKRLAHHVTARRNDLGLTQTQVAAAGGPSAATMRLIENALQPFYRPTLLGRLEAALRWQPGSVETILSGGDPTPTTPPAPTTPPTDTPVVPPGPGLETELAQIANNPARSARLRQWARDQLVEIAALRAADEAEAVARGERRAS
jgi:hypothetical protein